MMRQVRLAFLILALCWGVAPSADARTLIYAGHLIDGISEQAVADQTVVVEKGRIVDILDGFAEAIDGDEVIDLRKHTVLPGLMDMHTHLSHQGSRNSYLERFQLNPPDYAILSVVYAERTLLAGFTTVRDLGDIDNVTISLRNAIQRGLVPGPRIFTAGKSLATTGGHADRSNGMRAALQGDPGPKEGVVNSLDGAAQAVRYRYKDGADLIKITATGGVLSLAKNSQNPQFTEDLIRAVVATADDYGFIVAAHAHGAEGMKRAIRAGVRSIEHGTYMDDEAIALMKEHGTYLVPTLLAGKYVEEKAKLDDYFPAIVRPKAAAVGPLMQDTFGRAYLGGVKIAYGTDTGVSPHGENGREFRFMVEAGMPPMEAIQSATRHAAELLRIEGDVGTLQPGLRADVIAVAGDPLENIQLLEDVRFVMKDGKVYKNEP